MEHALPDIYVTTHDFERLSQLISHVRNDAADELEEELARAKIVPEFALPFAVVTMNSTVTFTDLESKKESKVTLVYPEYANVEEKKISVLAPIGIALIGLRLDEVIEWPVPSGHSRKLKVISIAQGMEQLA
ncbi:MAG TPA: nucleoside diphosphate kinase regulator [Bdellovibrionales bacterium]|nr:nucleoside diphosphate kinase regulator [Bdellovibrionales bacterium]